MKSRSILIVIGIVVLVGLIGTCTTYNHLVGLDQATQAQWAQVENAYQRRADLVPNLVATVQGAANFERETLIAVTEARSRVGQVKMPAAPKNAQDLREFQAAQDQLGATLSRLLVVSEQYPNLTATQNFRDLQAQLEGTENRISVERMRFNAAARDFNTARSTFPASVIAGMFGDKFTARAYFAATPGSSEPPHVKFSNGASASTP